MIFALLFLFNYCLPWILLALGPCCRRRQLCPCSGCESVGSISCFTISRCLGGHFHFPRHHVKIRYQCHPLKVLMFMMALHLRHLWLRNTLLFVHTVVLEGYVTVAEKWSHGHKCSTTMQLHTMEELLDL